MISYEELEQITGRRYDNLDSLSLQLPIAAPQPNDRQAWVNQALNSSLALKFAEANLEASRKSLSASRSKHLPTVAIFGSYSKDSDKFGGAVGAGSVVDGDTATTFGIRAELEIYGGGRSQASIRQGTYQLEAAKSGQDLAKRQVVQQTRSLFTQVNTDVLAVQARDQAIKSAESALEATRTGYEVGTRNIVDVLNAERVLWAAKRDYDSARYGYVINQLSLKRVAGSLHLQDLQELNNWLTTNK